MAEIFTIGSDFNLRLDGMQNSATSAYLNAGTATFALYTAAGVAVSGGTGSLSYVAASDGDYVGVIESSAVTLTHGSYYYATITFAEGSINAVKRVDILAQDPGSVIVDASIWQETSGQTVTGADLAAVRRHCLAVSAALERLCFPILLAPRTLTLYACDAPLGNRFYTPVRPCRSVTALYLRPGADGDSSLATSDYLLTNYEDYLLDVDDPLTGWSRSGLIYRRGYTNWGVELVRRYSQLHSYPEPNRFAIFLSGTFGPTSVSPVVQEAACRAVTLLYNRRTEGGSYASESWNGRSQSLAGPFSAEAAINTPDVRELLKSAGVLPIHVG